MRYAAAGLVVLAVLGMGSAWTWGARPAAPSPTAPAATPTVPAATPTAAAAPNKPAYAAALIKDVPHVEAKPDFTGEACTEMVLKQLGKKWNQDDVFNAAGVDPALARGCITKELGAFLGRIGFKVGSVFGKAAAARAGEEMEAQWRALHADLAAGIPSIVCMRRDDAVKSPETFRLVIGYDPAADEVIYQEPAEADGAARHMKRATFLSLWPLKYDKDSWNIVRLRMEAGTIHDAPPRAEGFTPADYAQHMMALKKKVPEGYSVVLSQPFAVVAEGSPENARRYADSTVKWTVSRIKADYFQKDPDTIIDVWLFKDDATYRKGAKEIFGDTPSTPYGYYSAQHNALIMNIGTGGGTLVHEIVHPFMRTNFPECPDWFNEGLASLYEQSEDRGGHIHGRTNWRLAGLQQAIKAKSLISFKDLCATTTSQFYNQDKGNNYAQARYLCYYMQEKGVLAKFYREFAANHKADPTGYKTLQRVLGEPDMAAFQKNWEEYVLKLTFP